MTETLSTAYIRRLQAMEQAACPGPWKRYFASPCVGIETSDCTLIHSHCSTGYVGPHTEANHEFIVALRAAAPDLLKEILRLRAQIGATQDSHDS